jgi:hypothetical protein
MPYYILFDFTGRISSLPLQVDHDQCMCGGGVGRMHSDG